jgi:chromosome segregation protein
LQSLEEIQRNYEGYQRGVRAVMLRREEAVETAAASVEGEVATVGGGGGTGADRGVLSVVADVITAPREYERAVAAVLGERLQYVVVRGAEHALGAVQMLRSEDCGRGSFIPISPRRIAMNGHGAPSLNGNTARLLDLVTVQSGYRDVAEMLLGDVVVVPDLPTALALWRRNGTHVTMVTRDGDVLDAYGVVTGGSDRPIEEEILARRREVQELEVDVADGAAQAEHLAEKVAGLTTQGAAEDAALRELDAGVHQVTLGMLAAQKDVERLQEEVPERAERIRLLQAEIDEAGREEGASIEEEGAIQAEAALLAERRQTIESELQALQQLAAECQVRIDVLVDGLTSTKIAVAEYRERQSALAVRAAEVVRQREEVLRQAERFAREQREAATEREMLMADAGAADAAMARAAEANAQLGVEMAAGAGAVQEAGTAATAQERLVGELRQAIEEDRATRSGHETRLAEKRVRREHLEQAMAEKHGVDLGADVAADEELDPEVSARLEQLRERLARMGEVSLGAIEEVQELETRAQFLRTQKDDLERSLADLGQTIAKLNRASRNRFEETFHQVDARFRSVLPRLFRGGEARLMLTDEHNLLETGVEIFVRPPGKKLDTVTLLSGGEKALVAVSLIFSLFLIKPTPFCFLDEVDAPLDDANVGRFVQLVKEMRDQSQFIIITHNKRTMEAADCLYGITMEEPGVSKVISVAMR